MKIYSIRVVRESGKDPNTGQFHAYNEQRFIIEAPSELAAYIKAQLTNTITAYGVALKVFINDKEYLGKRAEYQYEWYSKLLNGIKNSN